MTQIDPMQLMNLDGTPLTAEQVAALTPPPAPLVVPAADITPPAAPPVVTSRAEKELAAAKAGFDITNPLIAALAGAHEGPLDPESMTAAFLALGQTPQPAGTPAADAPPAAGGQADARQALAGTEYVAPPITTDDPFVGALKAGNEMRAEGQEEAVVLQVGIQHLIAASLNGDDRVSVAKHHDEGRLERWNELGLVNTVG